MYKLFCLLFFVGLSQVAVSQSLEELTNALSSEPERVHDSIYYELTKMTRGSDPDKALEYIKKVFNLSIKHNHPVFTENACYGLQYFYVQRGAYDSAHRYDILGLEYARKNQSFKREVIFNNNIGLYFQANDYYDSALSSYFKSLEVAETHDLVKDQAISLNNIGTIYTYLLNNAEAIKYFLQSVEIIQKNDILDLLDITYLNLGVAYLELSEYEAAKDVFRKNLELCNQIDCAPGMINKINFNLGYCSFVQKRYQESLIYINEALNGAQEMEDLQIVAECNYILADIAITENRLNVAYSHLMEAELYATNSDDKKLKKNIFELLSNYYELTGEYNKSIEYSKKFSAIKDSLFNEKMANNIRNILLDAKQREAQAIIQQKDLELKRTQTISLLVGIVAFLFIIIIVLLIRVRIQNKRVKVKLQSEILAKTRDLRKRNVDLAKSHRDYDHLIYRTSHDIRGPLSTLIGLTNLAKIEIKGGASPVQMEEYLDNIEGTAKGLTTTLSKLLQVDKVRNQDVQPEEIHLETFIKTALKQFKKLPFYSEIKVSIHIQPEAENVFLDKYFLDIILEKILENSFNYFSEPENESKIEIKVMRHQDKVKIVILDNGTGIDQNVQDKVFDLFFVAAENHGTGLGLYLAQLAAERMNGKIVLERNANPTVFSIYLPIEILKNNLASPLTPITILSTP